jgi:DNA-binding IclR family transcriptional regulator
MNDSIVKSVGRVFEVLELFDAERAALTATAIARTLKYPASSTVALLKSMVRLGYLTYDHTERTYFPTLRLPLIGYWLEHSFFVDGHLLELLDEVTNTTDESTCLSWQSDLDMQFVRYRVGSGGIPAPFMGSRMPLFATAAGLTALTQKRDVDIIKLLERSNHLKRKNDAGIDVPATMEQIRRFRAQGYGVEYDNPLTPGHGAIAWVLRQKGTSRCTVLSVTGASERIKAHEKNIVAVVKTALKRYGA